MMHLHRAIGLGLIGTAIAQPSFAQGIAAPSNIATDGTLGDRLTLQGPVYQIETSLGQKVGPNLFHSFEQFSLAETETAVFRSTSNIENILGRVTGDLPSSINGRLAAEHGSNLFLLNPNGILFGPNAQLAVGGSVTFSTAERFSFGNGLSFGLDVDQPPLLNVNFQPGLQLNEARGDIVQAGELIVPVGEKITLLGHDIQASGSFEAAGGQIVLLGDRITLEPEAQLNSSSLAGGGQIYIGGLPTGQGFDNPAAIVWIRPGATISADALERGNGGVVTIWADDRTQFAGSITARGGALSGDGGFVEVSGQRALSFNGYVDTTAPQGKVG